MARPRVISINEKRTGKERYADRKKKLYVRLKMNYDAISKYVNSGLFNLDKFCELLFPESSQKKIDIAKKIIEYLKEKKDKGEQVHFQDIRKDVNAPYVTFWQVFTCLKRAGIISRRTKQDPVVLSVRICDGLDKLNWWWKNFVNVRQHEKPRKKRIIFKDESLKDIKGEHDFLKE